MEIDKSRILRNLDSLFKIQQWDLKVWCLANNLREKLKKKNVCLNSSKTKRKYVSSLVSSIAAINYLLGKFSTTSSGLLGKDPGNEVGKFDVFSFL